VPVIDGFRSDLSITCKTDKNFGNISVSVLFFQSCVSTKTVVTVFSFVRHGSQERKKLTEIK